jgi:hypothetical protein
MITEGPAASQKTRRKPGRYSGCKPKTKRPLLESGRLYPLREGALACGCSISTLIRARNAGHLIGLRTGKKVQFAGKALIDWLEAGGRTGCPPEDVQRERGTAGGEKSKAQDRETSLAAVA